MPVPLIPSWLSGDGNGGLKMVSCKLPSSGEPINLKEPALKYILDVQSIPTSAAKPIHRLAAGTHADQNMIAIARADATTFLCEQDKLGKGVLSQISEWIESPQRFIPTQDAWVGLDICSPGILQCSQKGKARFTSLNTNGSDLTSHTCNLPVNLRHCKSSSSGTQFAYAGTEVNLSIWNTEVAFRSASPSSSPAPTGGKRTRKSDQLFPGEIWRAKNVPHDYLDLRQPIDITSLAFLSVDGSGSHQSIAVGNTLGCVHNYDTRKGRKPAFSWSDSRMSGGISLVEKGVRENELLVADCGTQLWTIDMRKTSSPLYAYKGLSGKVTSVSPSSTTGFSVAGSLDRYFRLLSSGPPSEGSGGVVGKSYVTSAPTAIIPIEIAGHSLASDEEEKVDAEVDERDDDWGEIQQVSSDEENISQARKKRRKRD